MLLPLHASGTQPPLVSTQRRLSWQHGNWLGMPSSVLRCGASQHSETWRLGSFRILADADHRTIAVSRGAQALRYRCRRRALLQDERLRRGYHQSVLEDETEEDNEAYNYRIKLMKNVVRAAITLSLEVSRAKRPVQVRCTGEVRRWKLGLLCGMRIQGQALNMAICSVGEGSEHAVRRYCRRNGRCVGDDARLPDHHLRANRAMLSIGLCCWSCLNCPASRRARTR